MDEPITWKVERSDRIHSIPNKAVVHFKAKNGKVSVWIDDQGLIHVVDERSAISEW